MSELRSRHLFDISITLHAIQELGDTPAGNRRVIPVSGGQFSGDRMRGEVLPQGGGDWLLARPDGAFQLDARITLRTDDGALILMSYRGVRHGSPDVSARILRGDPVAPTEYYLRTAPFFETAAPDYAWLNTLVSVGVGERRPGGAAYQVFEIL